MTMRLLALAAALGLAVALVYSPLDARDRASPVNTPITADIPAHGVIGIEDGYLTPAFWVARMDHPDRVLAGRDAINTQNARLFELDSSMHDLRALPAALDKNTVRDWIEDISTKPETERWDVEG